MNKLITIFKIPELAQKIGITLLFLVIYRIGYHVPLPFIDQSQMAKYMSGAQQVDEYGIGNGISLIIMAGIIARIPDATSSLLFDTTTGKLKESIFTLGGGRGQDVSFEKLVVLLCLFVCVVVAVIAITEGQRRIPTQSAKHVRGRRVFGGTRQYLPLRVNQAGVMPVIFAGSLLMIPVFG